MTSAEGRPVLARRLRALRETYWPGRHITQAELAEALGASVPLISSWESTRNQAVPPRRRLESYATFFATDRSIERSPYRIVDPAELTAEERTRREQLLGELMSLRDNEAGRPAVAENDPFAGNLWRFTPGQDITIVCSELPEERLRAMRPYTDPDAPDFIDLYRYADLDSLLELHGHLRAVNPRSQVHVRTPGELTTDEYTSHLVLLGGVDWNVVTQDLLGRVELPVRQLARESEDEPGGFEVIEKDERTTLAPKLRRVAGNEVLLEDVAHFYRAHSPFNLKRTVTICNGNYGRGVLGAVRALTDTRFRDRNGQYVRTRFAGQAEFSIVFRVTVVNGVVVTPDWSSPGEILHEWPVMA